MFFFGDYLFSYCMKPSGMCLHTYSLPSSAFLKYQTSGFYCTLCKVSLSSLWFSAKYWTGHRYFIHKLVLYCALTSKKKNQYPTGICYAPAIYNGGGHIASPLSVRPVRPVPYVRKWFPGDIFWKHWGIGFIFHTHVYNHKIQVKFDYGRNPPIIIRVKALDLWMKNGFRAISFEYSYVLDSYFIHRYIIIKYRSSSITGKIHQLSSELWPLISVRKWFPGDIFWIHWWNGFIFHTQVYNHRIQVKFDYG